MGSSGSNRYRGPTPDVRRKTEEAREREQARLNQTVDEYLSALLTRYNSRDRELIGERLDALVERLADVQEIDRVFFAGSVAKHTDVDGISDVDALVVINRADLGDKSPSEVLAAFHAELHDALPRSEVNDVHAGRVAVTITYKDGLEVQLLPAIGSGTTAHIADPSGRAWTKINPKQFQRKLTDANEKLGGDLIPAIKLLKSVNAELPSQKQLSGHHIEALAVDSASTFAGSKSPREVLIHLCKHGAERVLKPIKDISGQSHNVDDYLGPAGSQNRRIAAQALLGTARRLETAGSLGEWKAVFESK